MAFTPRGRGGPPGRGGRGGPPRGGGRGLCSNLLDPADSLHGWRWLRRCQ